MKTKAVKRWKAVIKFLRDEDGKQCDFSEMKLTIRAETKRQAEVIATVQAKITWHCFTISLDEK